MKLYKHWELVYAFTKKLAKTDRQFEQSLNVFKQSIDYNKRYHKLKIYSDKETFSYIKDFGIEIDLIEFRDFLFLDDIKIQIIPKLNENQILIDPDIFLFSELSLPVNCDVILDRPVSINAYWMQEQIESAKNYNFSKLLNFKPKEDTTGNIGIIKFFNKKLENVYIDFYNKVRDVAKKEKDTLPPFPSYSILLGELGLKNVIDKMGSNIIFANRISMNNYIHLAGPAKFETNSISEYLKPLNKTML